MCTDWLTLTHTITCNPLPRLVVHIVHTHVLLLSFLYIHHSPLTPPHTPSHPHRDEWQWFKSLSSPNPQPLQASTGPQSLQETLLPKIETFLHNLGIAKEDFPHHQLYKREAIELNEDITFLLLLPPAEHVCTPPGSTDHFAKLPDFVALPINTFEISEYI